MKPHNQYQHYVPRFILRAFQESPVSAVLTSSSGTSKKKTRRALQKERAQTETIHCYDLSTGEYNPSSLVAKSYGFINLYQDDTNLENIHHIEDKFAKLEDDAAKVIRSVQQAADGRRTAVDLLRKDLYRLRMFLFLLHIRSKKIGDTYFQEDHPNNAGIRNWIRRQKALHNLPSDAHLWLNGLEYYLNTGVTQILEDAQPKDPRAYSEMISMVTRPDHSMDPDTNIKYWHAQTYEIFHNWYYLSICKADPDSEFILGHNSFGIWEGTLGDRDGQVHRLYVISPQIAIILRLNITKVPLFNTAMVGSILNDIPFSPPVTRYINHPSEPVFQPPRYSPNDNFTFKITHLTKSQTYKVNEITLENLHADGTLTFASESKMLSTMLLYDGPHGSFLKPHRGSLRKLRDALSQRFTPRVPPKIQTSADETPLPTPPLLIPPPSIFEGSVSVPSPASEPKVPYTGQSSGDPLATSNPVDKNLGAQGGTGGATAKGDTRPEMGDAKHIAHGGDDIASVTSTIVPAFSPYASNAQKEDGQPKPEEMLCEMDEIGSTSVAFRASFESAPGADVGGNLHFDLSPHSPVRSLVDPRAPCQWPNGSAPANRFGNTIPDLLAMNAGLPVTPDDYLFDCTFKEALASWYQAGRRRDFSLLRMVYLRARVTNEVNHPVALKIRYMISDTVRQRIISEGDKVQFPWIIPKQGLEDFLTDTELQAIFSVALVMAKEDGLLSPNHNHDNPPSPTLTFVQDVAVYGYLTEWLHRQELIRLALRVRALETPGLHWKLYKVHAGPSPFLFLGICSIIQDTYCVWRFAGLDRHKLHALMLSFADTRAWYQRPLEIVVAFVFQLAGFSLIEKLVGRLTQLIFYGSLGLFVVWIAFGMIGMVHRRTTPRV